MPIYEYKCDTCKRVVEAVRSISECSEPLTAPCADDPQGGSVVKDCEYRRILSATPTTFRFNDTARSFSGLTKKINKK